MDDDDSYMTEEQEDIPTPRRWLLLLVALSVTCTCALAGTAYWLVITFKGMP